MSHRLAVRVVALVVLAAGLPAAAAPPKAAATATPETRLRYAVSLAGLPVARADMTLAAGADRYTSHLTWRTSGLVDVFAGGRGDAVASGQFGAARPVPTTYTLASGDGRKALKVMLAMAGGAVKAAEAQPPSQPSPDRVPLQPQHRLDVLDPLSATLVPAKADTAGADGVCNRTLPIFDGWSRYDIRLSPKTTLPNKRAGVTGPIVVCAARWVPVAGHRTENRVTKFMSANEDLSIAFGRLEKADVWVPLKVSIRTLVGMAEVDLETVAATGFDKVAQPH